MTDQIAAWLRIGIKAGHYEPDIDPLPLEQWLMDSFGVARDTARRAIGKLRDEGLVYTIAKRGTYVRAPEARRHSRRAAVAPYLASPSFGAAGSAFLSAALHGVGEELLMPCMYVAIAAGMAATIRARPYRRQLLKPFRVTPTGPWSDSLRWRWPGWEPEADGRP